MKRIVMGAAVVLAATSAVILGGATASYAASCPAGYVCLYQQNNYGGIHKDIIAQLGTSSLGTFGDQASSWINNSSFWICFYENNNFGGAHFSDGGGHTSSPLMPPGWNDRISSVRPCP